MHYAIKIELVGRRERRETAANARSMAAIMSHFLNMYDLYVLSPLLPMVIRLS